MRICVAADDPSALAPQYLAASSAVLTATAAVGLWWYQCHLIYPAYIPQGARTSAPQSFPALASATHTCPTLYPLAVPLPTEFGMPYQDLTLTTPDGVRIRAYLLLARSKADLDRIKGKKGAELEGEKVGEGDARFVSGRRGGTAGDS